jgi:hypothetical protein
MRDCEKCEREKSFACSSTNKVKPESKHRGCAHNATGFSFDRGYEDLSDIDLYRVGGIGRGP